MFTKEQILAGRKAVDAYRDRRVYYRQYWQEHREEKRIYRRQDNQKRKLRVLEHYSQNGIPECAKCKETNVDVLAIDHINNGGTKERQIAGTGNEFYRWLERNSYPNGFQVLCFNCN